MATPVLNPQIDLPKRAIALVLAGGRGSRMGGVDKGLQLLAGEPLARHCVQRLQAQSGGAPGLIANQYSTDERAPPCALW